MKKEERKETRKAKYEKPVLTKFKKLTDVIAQGQSDPVHMLGCARF